MFEGRFWEWWGSLLPVGLMAVLLYLEAQAPHPALVRKAVQMGIAVSCLGLLHRWARTHPHLFLSEHRREARQPDEQCEERADRSTRQGPASGVLSRDDK